MQYKVCTKCNKILPDTFEYFYMKSKEKIYAGSKSVHRPYCRVCSDYHNQKRRLLKRAKELGCSVEDVSKVSAEQNGLKHRKHTELWGLGVSDCRLRARIANKIENGYVFTTIEQYRKDSLEEKCFNQRKHTYEYKGQVDKGDYREKVKQILPDAIICNKLGKKLGELPSNIITTHRLLTKIRQKIKQLENG